MTGSVGSLFLLQEGEFFLNHFTGALAVEAARGAVGRNDSVAGDFRGEGVAPEGLADGLGAAAAYAARKLTV